MQHARADAGRNLYMERRWLHRPTPNRILERVELQGGEMKKRFEKSTPLSIFLWERSEQRGNALAAVVLEPLAGLRDGGLLYVRLRFVVEWRVV